MVDRKDQKANTMSMEPESDPHCSEMIQTLSPQANLAFRDNFSTIC